MKKILFVVMMVMVVSCGKNWLETPPTTIQLTDVALGTPAGLQGAIYAVYEYPRKHLRSMPNCYYFISGTHLVRAYGLLSQDFGMALYNNSLNSTHQPTTDFWNTSFQALRQANAIISRADKVGFTDVKAKNRLVAEARFFRAYIHFYLQQRFDRIPLDTAEILTPVNTFQPADSAAIYQVITDDLIFAINNLDVAGTPATATTPAYDPGRITKGAAQHLLAKVYMVMGQWANAAAMADSVINSKKYSLVADRSSLWADNSQNNNPEAIYVIQFANSALDGTDPQVIAPMFTPLIDRIPGVTRTFAMGGRPWARYFPSQYLIGLFEPNDKRLEADYKTTWLYNDASKLPMQIKYKDLKDTSLTDSVTIHLGDTVKWEHVTTRNPQYFGPACKKYWEYGTSRSIGDAGSRKSIIRYRLAETYLIDAEAQFRMGKMDLALPLINKVRERAGAHLFTTIDLDTILDEYARECAFEQEDWHTLKRMGKLVSMVKAHSDSVDMTHTEITQDKIRMPTPQSFLDATPGYHLTN
jgi:starch-binding outer membrane protein, SusD/RagB family